jgi:hypothetical protein
MLSNRFECYTQQQDCAGGEMVNRRTVLKIGIGALVNLPILGGNAFQRAIFDERFAECRAFAAELHRAGVFTSAISGDVADLWYGDLRAHLRKNRFPVTGLTDRLALFCLEELSRDVGMRVIFRTDHLMDRNEPPDAELGRAMASLLTRFASGPADTAAQKLTGPFSPANKTALVSWIIA